ncbi:MAG TPA: guanylate kinase, partial [Candidatus Deferrimicrobiaceae bacterium]
YTTRARKDGEADGRDYHFIDEALFDKMVNSNEFLEHANVYGNRYGTSREAVSAILAGGRDAVLEIDVQGGEKVRNAAPGAVSIAVFPPSPAALRQRLEKRGRDSAEEIGRRLDAASREVRALLAYDYIVVNDELQRAVTQIEWIVRACRLRNGRARETVERTFIGPGEDKRWRG